MLTIVKVRWWWGGEVAAANLELITDKIKSNSPVVSRANLYPFNWLENWANLYFITKNPTDGIYVDVSQLDTL